MARSTLPTDDQKRNVFKSTVSEELPAEERHLQRLQRMATLGTLASGLGHDLRNLVMPVLLRLDVVTASPDLPEKARLDLASIRQSILRLQKLAGGLRLLASDPFDQRDESQLTNLHDWWEELQPIVADALPPHSTVDARIESGLPIVAVPPGTLAQILINLVLNSRQAMEFTASPRLVLGTRSEAGRILLDVQDNGSGMDEETRRRCFEPYFTTRARGYATGLGLSTGRALLNRYGGDLLLGHVQDIGTTFTLVMPTRAAAINGQNGTRKRVRVLVRDPRQLAILRMLIRHRGFEELAPTVMDRADLTICDVEALPLVLQGNDSELAGGQGDVIAIGPSRPESIPDSVRWVDAKDFAVLDDVLH
jgi:signal transduction histidine kinase